MLEGIELLLITRCVGRSFFPSFAGGLAGFRGSIASSLLLDEG